MGAIAKRYGSREASKASASRRHRHRDAVSRLASGWQVSAIAVVSEGARVKINGEKVEWGAALNQQYGN